MKKLSPLGFGVPNAFLALFGVVCLLSVFSPSAFAVTTIEGTVSVGGSGLANVSVEATAVDGGTYDGSAVTNGSGFYRISDLTKKNYRITAAKPAYTVSSQRVGWYRKPITISNPNAYTLTDYQVKFIINTQTLITQGKMQSDGRDIRFSDNSGNPISYFLGSNINTAATEVWIKAPSLPAGDTTVYFYYGNFYVTSQSSGDDVFIFYDNFSTDKGWVFTAPAGRMGGSADTGVYYSPSRSYKIDYYNNNMFGDISQGYWTMPISAPGSSIEVDVYLKHSSDVFGCNSFKRIYLAAVELYNVNINSDGTDWIPVTVTASPAAGSVDLQVSLYCNNGGPNLPVSVTLWMDDVMVHKSEENPPTYIFGSEVSDYSGGYDPGSVTGVDFSLSSAWPMFRQDRWHTGNSPDTALSLPIALERSIAGGGSSAAIANGKIYVADGNFAYAINEDMGGGWSYDTGGAIPNGTTPALANGRVYIGSGSHKFFALNDTTGALVWSYNLGSGTNHSATVSNGRVYFGTSDSKLYALNESDGSFAWSRSMGRVYYAVPAAANGRIYMGSDDSKLYALNEGDGSPVWSFNAGYEIQGSPAVANSKVYVPAAWDKLYALNESDGSVAWSFSTGNYNYSTPAVKGNRIYYYANPGIVYCLDDAGSQLWSCDVGDIGVNGSPAIANGIVYVAGYNLYAIDENTGALLASYSLTASAQWSSPSIANGRLYIGSNITGMNVFHNAPGVITGTVEAQGGGVLSGVTVTCEGFTSGIATTDAFGIYTISGLLPGGGYNVYAGRYGYIPSSESGVTVAQGGTTHLNFAMIGPIIGSISGSITLGAPPSATVVSIEAFENRVVKGSAATPAGGGAYTISGLFPGTYSVEAFAQGYEQKSNPLGITVFGDTHTGIDITLNRAWPMFGQDRWQTGSSPDTVITPPLKMKWSYRNPVPMATLRAVSDGNRIYASDSSNVYAFNISDGGLNWSLSGVGGNFFSQDMIVANGLLYVGSQDNFLYALNISDGSTKWSTDLGSDVNISRLADGLVFAYNGTNLYGCDQFDGSLKWSYACSGYPQAAIADGMIYLTRGNVAYAVNVSDSSVKWSYAGNPGELFTSPAVSTSMALVYFGSQDSKLYALNMNDGSERWNYTAGASISDASSPAISGDSVYFGCNDNKLYCLNADTGALNWRSVATTGCLYSVAIANGYVYAGNGDKTYAFKAGNGQLAWSYDTTTGNFLGCNPIVVNGMLFFSGGDYTLHAYESCGTGTISGTTRTSGGSALSQVTVVATGPFTTSVATSDGAGAYTMTGVYEGSGYSVSASKTGYFPSTQTGVAVTLGGTTTVDFSLSATPTGASWPTFHYDTGRTGYSSFESTLDPSSNFGLVWSQVLGGSVESSPAISGGNLYVGCDDGYVYAFDAVTGAPSWSYATGGPVKSSPTVFEGKVYFGSDDFKLHAVDATTGLAFGSFPYTATGAIKNSPLVVTGSDAVKRVIFGTEDNKVIALNATNGAWLFTYSDPTAAVTTPITYLYFTGLGDLYIAGDRSGVVHAITNAGTAIVTLPLTNPVSGAITMRNVGGASINFHIPSDTNFVNQNSGGPAVWTLPAGVALTSPAFDGTNLYVGADNGYVASLLEAGVGGNPSINWSFATGAAVKSSPAVANGYVYVGSNDCKIYAINKDTGAGVWSYQVDSPVKSSPAIANGMLFVGCNDKAILAFGVTTTTVTTTTTTTTTGTTTTTLPAPINPQASVQPSGDVLLTWQGSAVRYAVERRNITLGQDWSYIATWETALSITNFDDANVLGGLTYEYRIYAYDSGQNLSAASPTVQATPPRTTTGPTITNVKFDARLYSPAAGEAEIISNNPRVEADISDKDGVDLTSIRVTFSRQSDSKLFGPYTLPGYQQTTVSSYEVIWGCLVGQTEGEKLTPAHSDAGTFLVSLEAADKLGNWSLWNGRVKVYPVTAQVVVIEDLVIVSQPSIDTSKGESMQIGYSLSKPTPIVINIVGTGGPVWQRRFSADTMGGYAGRNIVEWDGNNMQGEKAGNGIYVLQVATPDGKLLGKGYLVVHSK